MEENNTHFQNFSETTLQYILNAIPPYLGLVILQVDEGGKINYWNGPIEKYFDVSPQPQQSIDEFTPYLVGMIPPLTNPMVVSHLRVKDNLYVEAHFLTDEQRRNWIFLIDQTHEIKAIHPILQFYNEEKLSKRNDPQTMNVKGAVSALYLLDYIVFERDKTETYKLIGQPPSWIHKLPKKLKTENNKALLIEMFPFIEMFQLEAAPVWNSQSDARLMSGMWEERDIHNKNIYLHAVALHHDQRNYMLIKPVSQQNEMDQGFLQKAREQRITLDKLAVAEKKLKQLLSFKDQFISIISHDLRSPIGAVMGLASLLLNDKDLHQKMEVQQIELLEDIKSEMRRLLDYNEKLFQWSYLELGNFTINRKKITPEELALYVQKIYATQLKQKQIQFSWSVDPAFTLEADETLLGQAMNNLIGNSVKFTPKGGTIYLKFIIEKNQRLIVIQDTGIGMDEEICKGLFTDFIHQSTAGTKGETGTGLGLGIVKKIIDAHGFSITAHSKPGKGSVFTILIPE